MPDALASSHVRLFIAVTVPEEVKASAQRAQDELRRALPAASVRWSKPDQFHLTLRFLGNVEAAQLPALQAAAREMCGRFAPLRMRAERLGCFPLRGIPRVIWAGVRDEGDRLPELQQAIQRASAPFTSEPAEERFTGHVTLGRIKAIRRGEAEELTKAIASMAENTFGRWTASAVEFMRSELSPAGACHSTLATLPLIGVDAGG